MTESIGDLLANHPLLKGLPSDLIDLLAGCARNVAFRPGHLLIAEGQSADHFFLIRRGRVSLEVHVPGRTSVVIETFGPGQIVGWSWLIPPYVWHFDARASEPVGAVSIDGACLRGKAEADPKFGYELMKRFTPVLVDRLDAARVRLLDLYAGGRASTG